MEKMENEIEIAGVIGVILGLYRDTGKENGNYHVGLGFMVWGFGFEGWLSTWRVRGI